MQVFYRFSGLFQLAALRSNSRKRFSLATSTLLKFSLPFEYLMNSMTSRKMVWNFIISHLQPDMISVRQTRVYEIFSQSFPPLYGLLLFITQISQGRGGTQAVDDKGAGKRQFHME